jgi:hypothetical protein
MKTVPCLITNPYCPEPPLLLTLRENRNFTAEQYYDSFMNLFALVESAELAPSAMIIANLPAQFVGLEQLLRETGSPVIHIRCFAHMANLIRSHIVPSGNFARIMAALIEVQNLLRRTSAHEAIGAKCPRFIRTRWFYMNDTLAFILEHAGPSRRICRWFLRSNPLVPICQLNSSSYMQS